MALLILALVNVIMMSLSTVIILKWFFEGTNKYSVSCSINIITMALLLILNLYVIRMDGSYDVVQGSCMAISFVFFGVVVGPTLTMLFKEYSKKD